MNDTQTGSHSRQEDGLDTYFQIDNLPNRLTFFRIILIPVVLGCLFLTTFRSLENWHSLAGWVAGWTFTAAAITDYFDGYFARKKNIVTVFGSFLDPIADKFLVVSSLIVLLALGRIHVFVVVVLTLREIYMTSLRLLAQSEGISVPVNKLGKWKTVFQLIGIPMIMANEPLLGLPLSIIGPLALYVATFLSVYSGFKYTVSSLQKLKAHKREKRLQKIAQKSDNFNKENESKI